MAIVMVAVVVVFLFWLREGAVKFAEVIREGSIAERLDKSQSSTENR